MPEFLLSLNGGDVTITAEPGETVFAASRRSGAMIQTVCKGRGVCGACRVIVPDAFLPGLAPPSKNEARLLDYLNPGSRNHRLACQIVLTDLLDGLRVTADPLPIRTNHKETTI